MFTLAHLSDLHLGPLPAGSAHRHFAFKRAIGVMNWRLNRHRVHSPAVALAVAADIMRSAPDHVALTGDIVNVAARDEFTAAARWMDTFGTPDWISFVPGNHDCYVRMAWEHGLFHLEPYMRGDMRVPLTQETPQILTPFPYVRLRRNVALIGLSSGVPQPLHRASGQLGRTQLKSLAGLLSDLRERGYARVVMIHHPPLPGLASPRKALIDASLLRGVLEEHGAELVLHGHNHEHMLNTFNSRFGAVHVLGVPSASLIEDEHHPVAAWNLYRIQRQAGKWQIDVSIRSYDPASRQIAPLTEFALSS
ncbi:metallophosphoesterase [Aestuariivirga litoralis]|uniref:Metallophosphoesterase n=1 Tax=Aestuariivirga litoralis TaxID=2650924 RepID=A0A2W2CDW9_9HYPH|nr:metallophosphoesterase [Aestuariivirga litoralis]PZF78443.1 metallophosphoesterase [Aestuariivirga litoralis]